MNAQKNQLDRWISYLLLMAAGLLSACADDGASAARPASHMAEPAPSALAEPAPAPQPPEPQLTSQTTEPVPAPRPLPFAVHLESYRTTGGARRAAASLPRRMDLGGHPVVTLPVKLAGRGTWVRVLVAGFSSYREVTDYCKGMRVYCMPVHLDPAGEATFQVAVDGTISPWPPIGEAAPPKMAEAKAPSSASMPSSSATEPRPQASTEEGAPPSTMPIPQQPDKIVTASPQPSEAPQAEPPKTPVLAPTPMAPSAISPPQPAQHQPATLGENPLALLGGFMGGSAAQHGGGSDLKIRANMMMRQLNVATYHMAMAVAKIEEAVGHADNAEALVLQAEKIKKQGTEATTEDYKKTFSMIDNTNIDRASLANVPEAKGRISLGQSSIHLGITALTDKNVITLATGLATARPNVANILDGGIISAVEVAIFTVQTLPDHLSKTISWMSYLSDYFSSHKIDPPPESEKRRVAAEDLGERETADLFSQ